MEKINFEFEVDSNLRSLEFQRRRIFAGVQYLDGKMVSPVHEVDYYIILLRRLYRKLEKTAKYDSRVANLKGKYKELCEKIRIRDHFEHGVNIDILPSIDSNEEKIPGLAISGSSNLKIATSVFDNIIVSGEFRWDLNNDNEKFIKLINEYKKLYPFT